jgi:hypothetical protein
MNEALVLEVVGVFGAAILFTSYFLVSTGKIVSKDIRNQSLNLVGAVMLATNAAYHHAVPPALLNLLWALIAANAIRKTQENGQSER